MQANDADPTRADVVLEDRYAAVSDCTGRTLIYDVDDADAWVRADEVVDLDERR